MAFLSSTMSPLSLIMCHFYTIGLDPRPRASQYQNPHPTFSPPFLPLFSPFSPAFSPPNQSEQRSLTAPNCSASAVEQSKDDPLHAAGHTFSHCLGIIELPPGSTHYTGGRWPCWLVKLRGSAPLDDEDDDDNDDDDDTARPALPLRRHGGHAFLTSTNPRPEPRSAFGGHPVNGGAPVSIDPSTPWIRDADNPAMTDSHGSGSSGGVRPNTVFSYFGELLENLLLNELETSKMGRDAVPGYFGIAVARRPVLVGRPDAPFDIRYFKIGSVVLGGCLDMVEEYVEGQ
ncbi:hypothetical protein GGR56DRAFT_458307 [Xylariaceae sp. FL0804]|nr:hypothetical protein GGR56DRAFT_458307 [Xylariaceae sp. FL0804]